MVVIMSTSQGPVIFGFVTYIRGHLSVYCFILMLFLEIGCNADHWAIHLCIDDEYTPCPPPIALQTT